MQKQNIIQEDEIDLKELFLTLYKKKFFILGFTLFVTILSIIYVFFKTPIYEVNALVEIGSYKSKDNSIKKLDNANFLVQKLNVIFIEQFKNQKLRKSKVISIKAPKKQNDFIQINAEGIDNTLAKKEIIKVVSYIQLEHKKILDEEKEKNKLAIANIVKQIDRIKNKDIKNIEKKILLSKKSLKIFDMQLKKLDKNVKDIENTDPSLAALKLMEKRRLSDNILRYSMELIDFETQKDKIETVTLSKLEEEKNNLESILFPYNYKNTKIVGNIIKSDYPTKPKKKLIIIVSFVTGFVLSIFLILFIQFIIKVKEES